MIDLNAQPKHLLTQASLPNKVLWLATFIQWYQGFYTSCFRNWDFQIWKKWKYHMDAFGVPLLEERKACKFHLVCVNCREMDLKSPCPQPVSMVLVWFFCHPLHWKRLGASLFNTMEIWAMTHICLVCQPVRLGRCRYCQ
jgi:hypothetical protein